MSLLGIISSFLILGLLASFIKLPFAAANQDTQMWGAIFQNRYFILIITLLVVLFIDIQRGRCNINIYLNNKLSGGLYHFLSGMLSTVLASPCVAPVIGLSLVFSANSGFIQGIAIFIAIGLGFGLPYIISFFYPDIYKKLPKTGLFSIWLKHILSLMLFLTFFWLLYVIALQSGMQLAMVIMVGIFVFSHYGWKMKKNSSRLILFIALVIPMFAVTSLSYDNKTEDDKMWQIYSAQKLDKTVSEDGVVLILGTADWCSWCHILEKTVLERTAFMDFVTKNNIVLLKVDLTDSDSKEANDFYKSQPETGLPILRIYSNSTPNGRSIIMDSFSVNGVIGEIETEISSIHIIDKK
jgi:suppressor for copper-sensitivity B